MHNKIFILIFIGTLAGLLVTAFSEVVISENQSEDSWSLNDKILAARNLRHQMWSDRHRPKFHHLPPEGFFNDANGTVFWKGRYHLFYLARTPIPHRDDPSKDRWVAIWDHVSSHDLLHWIFHPPAVVPKFDGSTPQGIYSGGAVKNAPRPTLIYHVPGQGTCISVAEDDDLDHWTELTQNPVIKPHQEEDEFVVFDPAAWYENGIYYALIGNKNKKEGFAGDCTSLFKSLDLIHWEYQGPFYKSDRKWTLEAEDAACPDFFQIGNTSTYMLLLHGHRPYRNITHYYLGKYQNERFIPQQHGRMSWLGGQLSGPESLIDDQGRNIFFGWIAENRNGSESLWGYDTEVEPGGNDRYAWASVISLPRVMSLAEDGSLAISPVPELEGLRSNPRERSQVDLKPGEDLRLSEMSGDVMELAIEIDPMSSKQVGLRVRCAPDHSEQTLIYFDQEAMKLIVNFEQSTLLNDVTYRGFYTQEVPPGENARDQAAPLRLKMGENLKMRIFLDKSVLEVFANDRQCITQRIYPSRTESIGIELFTKGGEAKIVSIMAWDLRQTTPW